MKSLNEVETIEKEQIRKLTLKKINLFNDDYIKECQDIIFNKLVPILSKVNKVAVYHAYQHEIPIDKIIEFCLKNNVKLYQPTVSKLTNCMYLEAYSAYNTNIFCKNDCNPTSIIDWQSLDLIIIPLIAVDRVGNRVGRGQGYYDLTLNNIHSPLKISVGYHVQLLDKLINPQIHDVKIDLFCSEKELLNFNISKFPITDD